MNVIYINCLHLNTQSDQYKQYKKDGLLVVFKSFHKFYVLIDEEHFNSTMKYDLSIFNKSFLQEIPRYKDLEVPNLWSKFKENTGFLFQDGTYTGNEGFNNLPDKNGIFFSNCTFKSEGENFTDLSDGMELQKYYFCNCSFDNLVITLLEKDFRGISENDQKYIQIDIGKRFYDCTFDTFQYYSLLKSSLLYLDNNKNIGFLITDSEIIRLKNLHIKLIHHSNLNNSKNDFGFDNVEVDYDPEILKKLDKSQYTGFVNTFKNLLENNGLYSERKNISIYLSYFSSRKSWIKKILFNFNQGYYGIKYPFYFTVFLILLKMCILWCFREDIFSTPNPPFRPIIFPHKMYKIIFQYFSLNLSPVRIFLLLIELTYIYSMFSFLTGVKRFLGFKIEL